MVKKGDIIMEFKSAICTSIEQSKRLLELGLKKETADMYRPPSWGGDKIIDYYVPNVVVFSDHFIENPNDLPAWSLHRLTEILALCPYEIYPGDNVYKNIIDDIEEAIKDGLFNTDYLEK